MRQLLSLLFILFLYGNEAQFIRYPAPSPDGKIIAFSYQGDIWLVPVEGGSATRLTVHQGYDYKPLWSSDGNRIAFVSDRNGHDNIYSMTKDGRDIKRHSFYNGGDILLSWSDNNQALIFLSKRFNYYHWMPEFYKVSIDGKTPYKHLKINAVDGVVDKAEENLYFVTGYNHRWRKRYRGSANNSIFSYNYKNRLTKKLTQHNGNNLNPMPSGKSLYYITDKSGFFNIHKMSLDGSKDQQITTLKSDGIRYARLSFNGEIMAFTDALSLYTLNTKTGKYQKISVQLPEDSPFSYDVYKNFSSKISEVELAPNGKEFAIVYHGELYSFKKDDKENGRISRLTKHWAKDHDIIWGKDSKSLYFLSDRNGQEDLFKITAKKKAPFYLNKYFKLSQLTKTSEDESNLRLSPDGKYLSFQRGNGDLYIYNIKTKKERKLLSGWNLNSYNWSPDNKWIAYSRSDNNFNDDIFIISVKGGKAVNISQHPDGDYNPTWSPDGRLLSFSSKRYGNSYDVMYVFLRKSDANKAEDDWDLEKEYEALQKSSKKKKKGSKKKKTKTAAKTLVKIDFEDIHLRVKRLTNNIGNEFPVAFSKDGKEIFYTLRSDQTTDLYKKNIWKKKAKRLTKGNARPSSIRLGPKAKTIFYKNNSGKIKSVSVEGKSSKSYGYSGKFTQNKLEEFEQVFNEVWRVQNNNFYDSKFHGANWQQIRKDYLKKVKALRSDRDFADAMNMMLGELNASHQRYSNPRKRSKEVYGNLGIDVVPSKNGVKIVDIMPEGSLTKSKLKAKIGDIITEVDGEGFSNFYSTLRGKTGKLLDLTVLRGGKKLLIQARPSSHRTVTNTLAYKRWTKLNREKVHQASQNKIAYIHIKGMSIPSLEDFETKLYAEAEGKDALIIDVRFNGGGWTTDFLLSILFTQEHAYTIPRGGGVGYPQGRRTFYHWTKPIVVLCNEFSYSNAEIFSHAIKNLNRGKLVGNTSFGAVISTGGKGLLNGGFVRMPFRGWYVKKDGMNQENNGAVPDYLIVPKPDERLKGIDRQLDKAIELLK